VVHSNLAALSEDTNVAVLAKKLQRLEFKPGVAAVSKLNELVGNKVTSLNCICNRLVVVRLGICAAFLATPGIDTVFGSSPFASPLISARALASSSSEKSMLPPS